MLKLKRACLISTCKKEATYEVKDRYNGNCGAFCTMHAKQRVKELQRSEAKS